MAAVAVGVAAVLPVADNAAVPLPAPAAATSFAAAAFAASVA